MVLPLFVCVLCCAVCFNSRLADEEMSDAQIARKMSLK